MGKRNGGKRANRRAGQAERSRNTRFHGRPTGRVAAFSGSKEAMFGGKNRGILTMGEKLSKGEAFALSGKRRRREGGRPVAGIPGQTWDPGSRRQRRKDEREDRKRRKLEAKAKGSTASGAARRRKLTNAQLMAAEAGGNRLARDSDWGKDQRKLKMQMQRTVKEVEEERERLSSWIPPEVEAEIQAREAMANERLKSLHPVARKLQIEHGEVEGYVDPGSGECIACFKRPPADNLFEKVPAGQFWTRPETRQFCKTLSQAAAACRAAGHAEEAAEFLRELEQLDDSDALDIRAPLVLALLDATDAVGARKILERHPQDMRCALQWSRALLEYISWAVLEEPGATEETAKTALNRAVETNAFVAVFIAHADSFTKFVDPGEVDRLIPADGPKPNPGVVDEALRYCVDGLSCWRDAEGSQKWVRDALPTPLPNAVGSEHWISIYDEALQHAMEKDMIAALGGDGDDAEGGSLDEITEQNSQGVPVFDKDGSLLGFQRPDGNDSADIDTSNSEAEEESSSEQESVSDNDQ